MAHFYGRLEGDGNEVTRRGTKSSGLRVIAETRDYKIAVYLHHDGAQDIARVELARGEDGMGRVIFSSTSPMDAIPRDGWKEHLKSLLNRAPAGVMDEIIQEYAERKLRERSGA